VPRDGGYADIRDYAAIGDGRSVALVARDGQVDWLAIPAMDSPPAFAGILDPDVGGAIELRPTVPFDVDRCYVERSNVLQTTFRTRDGVVRVTDSVNFGATGPLPWGELARRVECLSGEVPMSWSVRPGNRFGNAEPWAETRNGSPVLTLGDQHLLVLPFDVGEVIVDARGLGGEFTAGRDMQSGLLVLTYTDREPMFRSRRAAIETRIEHTIRTWQGWTQGVVYEGPWRDQVLRSALALKLLVYVPTGAVAAAPTTSLPEWIGGDRNWDYRYAWVRDSAFTVDAFVRLGLHEEMHEALAWLLRCAEQTSPELHVFYTLRGRVADRTTEVDLRGYRDSRPVRAGNTAEEQLQLGNFGDLLESVWYYVREGHLLDEGAGQMLAGIADRACDVWRREDSGIWELDHQRHYTISKMGCWVALDRAVQLAEHGQLPAAHIDRWRNERSAVRAWVEEHCWSAERRAFTFYAGSDALDASVLLAARNRFCSPDDKRLLATLEAVRDELADGPLLYRYSGMRGHEGAFVACSFWLVEALAKVGRVDEAAELMEGLLALGNDVGLYAEEMEPGTGAFLGNFPQGLSHLALVNAASVPELTGGPRAS
jgi:GH15 family glucan-1,4-alpha-glucosidase